MPVSPRFHPEKSVATYFGLLREIKKFVLYNLDKNKPTE
jgi:hypothetical protein